MRVCVCVCVGGGGGLVSGYVCGCMIVAVFLWQCMHVLPLSLNMLIVI